MKGSLLGGSICLSALAAAVALGGHGTGHNPGGLKPPAAVSSTNPINSRNKVTPPAPPRLGEAGKKPVGLPPGQPGLTKIQKQWLGGIANNPQTPVPAQAALGNLLAGGFLSGQERQTLADLIAGGKSFLSEEEQKALAQGLEFDAERKKQVQRQFVIQNDTGERLRIWVHYYTLTDQGQWAWTPPLPADPGQALEYRIGPGSFFLKNHDVRITANRVRVWAVSDSGRKWLANKDHDLLLVPDVDDTDPNAFVARVKEPFHVHLFAARGPGELDAVVRK
jgi:hypothetical protein